MSGGGGGDELTVLMKVVGLAIQSVRKQIKDADQHLKNLHIQSALLQDHINSKKEIYPETVKAIRNILNEIKGETDKYTILIKEAKSSRLTAWFREPKAKLDLSPKLGSLITQVQLILNTVPENPDPTTDRQQQQQQQPSPEPMVRVHDVVGFDDQAETIIDYLLKEKDQLDVVSIVGMPGLGKTTLAKKIHDSERLTEKFPMENRIWLPVMPTSKPTDVLGSILRKLPGGANEVPNLIESNKLARRVEEKLQNLGRFLITIDDVRSLEFWNNLKQAFPEKPKGGKILITSQLMDVARCANHLHKLRFLTLDESCQLLRLEVPLDRFPDKGSYLKSVSTECGGLPYLILKMGEKVRGCNSWEDVSKNFTSEVHADFERDLHRTFSSSYDELPERLKECFLYLGTVPEEFKVSDLIRLWISEGLIRKTGTATLEEAARKDLKDLVNRNLVMMNQDTISANENKICRVHCMVRELCKYEASYQRQNLFQEIKYHGGEILPPSTNLAEVYRIRIDSNVQGFLNSQHSCPRVSSFICFSNENLGAGHGDSSIPEKLVSLKVLQAKFSTYKISWNDWKKLRFLKHVVLSISNLEVVPKVISKLWSMETLVIHTTSRMLTIEANICRMRHLKHVETNAPTKLPNPKKSKKENKLLTLGTISGESCTKDMFEQVRHVQKLHIHGQLDKVLNDKSLAKLNALRKLKLGMNDPRFSQPSEGSIQGLPDPYEFPKSLTSLTLSGTGMNWSDHMPTLALLNTLEKLKLKNKAFSGDSWVVDPFGFQELQVLHIEDSDLQCWTVGDNCLKDLKFLIIINCMKLVAIPPSLAKIKTLQKMCLHNNGDQLNSSATQAMRQQKQQGSTFKLYINGNEVNDLPHDH